MRANPILSLAAALSVTLIAPLASAQDSGAALFHKGLTLYRSGDTAAACDAFQKSYKLQPATGTLYNLAKCHATQGRYWEARGEFLKLAGEMDDAGDNDKAKIARDQATAAEAHVPKIALAFPPDSKVSEITVDGNDIDPEKWKTPIPVAPGLHVLMFTAERYKGQQRSVEAQGDGTTVQVDVPVLQGRGTLDETASSIEPRDHSAPHEGGWTSHTTALVVGGGVTVVGLGIGVGFALAAAGARSKRDDLLTQLRLATGEANPCATTPKPDACAGVVQDNDAANNDNTGAAVGFTIAGVAAVGTVIFVLWPRHSNNAAIVPVLGRHAAGVAASGSF